MRRHKIWRNLQRRKEEPWLGDIHDYQSGLVGLVVTTVSQRSVCGNVKSWVVPRTDFAGRSTLEFFVRARGGEYHQMSSEILRGAGGPRIFVGEIRSPENWDSTCSQECVTWRRLRWSSGDKAGCAGRPRSGLPYVASAWERWKTKLVGTTGDGFYFGFEFIKDELLTEGSNFVGVFWFFASPVLWLSI